MMHRFGAVFGIAVASSVFAAYGGPGSPALVAAGLRPAVAAGFALLALAVFRVRTRVHGHAPTRAALPTG
jgi:hypothetical protein